MENRNKVTKITLGFWVMKIIATVLGETIGDFLSTTVNFGYLISLGITLLFFAIVLTLQLRVPTYHPFRYWLAIVAGITLGIEVSDFMGRSLEMGYLASLGFLFGGLIMVFFFWHKKETHLKIYPITQKRIEIYYWLAIIWSTALGTALGDTLSDHFGRSYFYGTLVTGIVLTVLILLYRFTKMNRTVLFWMAFIATQAFWSYSM